ncbi:inter-alpha-trypsin inhibitor heavy chain H6 isoform X3 [Girardinichthys multiradiatus]|uniref:inter-alpha-trypsin inhibitor heavy chain H6 isoform X3 n=1 Tax=Girardinichthys multiradiatus TaxID=208333 RepID=UPI001FAC61E5|nr:inter-alpha-trypsin inhibitor heavy chain H6 isoform X3 [Girardinichthys multiradiatus]
MRFLKIHYFLLCVYYCVQEGLSGDFKAHFRNNFHFQRTKRHSKPAKRVLKVTDYHVRCSVMSRYAVTTIQSSVWNQLPIIKEAAFEVDLPSSAFISNFTIASNGKVYVAQVKERAAARKLYDDAKKQGKTAGLVATKEREIEKFRVAVSVLSGSRMSFLLTYEELLPRRLGRYELSLGLRPGQPVENLTLDVSIHERTGISFIKVLPLKTSRLLSNAAKSDLTPPVSTRVEQSDSCARIYYSPTLQQQNSLSSKGLNADYIIQYDVDLGDLIGDVQVYDGYFVHYFAPRGLPVVPKDIIFVIDVSGSMIGTKIKQTKQAMNTILGDLREGDHFNIITFSDKVHTWKKGRTVRATWQNVRDAKEFVRRIIAEGWTNINAALLSAAQLVNPSSSESSSHLASHRVPLVIFLTDGEATTGVTSGDTILNNAKKALGPATLFGIAFGDDADFLLLKRLTLENRGVARMVYEEADAALQLKGFYDEVANPLLSDIQLSYMDDQAFDVTHSLFPNYFQGSELVVAGRVKPGVKELKVSVSATDSKQNITLEDNVFISSTTENGSTGFLNCSEELEGVSNFVHRLWAYFTIKELLLAKLNATDPVTQRLLADKAINLSLKYNFVTPVTSLVVVKPDADEAAQALTTVKPTTGTTTTTTVVPTKIFTAGIPRKLSLPSNHRPKISKPDPPRPPANKMTTKTKTKSLPKLLAKKVVSSCRKTAINPSLSPIKTAKATYSGKKLAASHNDSKTLIVPDPSVKIPTSLLNALKAAQPPAPGRNATPVPNAMKITTVSTTTVMQTIDSSTSPHLILSRIDPSPMTRGTLPQRPSPGKTAVPSVRGTGLSSEVENHTKSASDLHQSETTPVTPLSSPTPASAPVVEDNNVNLDVDTDLSIATLVLGTFAPMPGVTDGPGLWEATGFLDVSTSIQSEEDLKLVKDYDATYNYDYDISYDTWDDRSDSFEPQSRLNSVRLFSSSVDGDPHFVVKLPKLHQNLCFTVDGRADDVLRLLEDPDRGIIVDGHLMGAPPKPGAEGRSRTYFDQLTISLPAGSPPDIIITLSLDGVVVDGEGREILPINQQGSVTRQGVTVTVDNHQSCWIELAKGVRFLVLFHYYKQPNYLQMAHLGFYITDGRGLSRLTQGLLGQFQHSDMIVTVTNDHLHKGAHPHHKEEVLARGILRWGSQEMPVTLQEKTVKDSVQKRHLGKCWMVPKAEIERLLSHSYESYVVNNA